MVKIITRKEKQKELGRSLEVMTNVALECINKHLKERFHLSGHVFAELCVCRAAPKVKIANLDPKLLSIIEIELTKAGWTVSITGTTDKFLHVD